MAIVIAARHEIYRRPDGQVMQIVTRVRDGRVMCFGPGDQEKVHAEAIAWGRS